MKRYSLPLIILLALSICLISCKRKIPITVYSGTGIVCYEIEPLPADTITDVPLNIHASISYGDGNYSGNVTYLGSNSRNTGFTVEVDEGAWVMASGGGWCCCPHDTDTSTLNYSYELEEPFLVDTQGMFSKPHYYIVYRANGIEYYYE